jgi:hypothetical protein
MLNSYIKNDVTPLSFENNVVEATLTKVITFNCIDGLSVILPIGTEITVDLEQSIGVFESYNFDLSSDEYQENEESTVVPNIVLATLTKHICFMHPMKGEVFIKYGTNILVDLKEKVGISNDCFFDIEADEFLLL